MSERTAGPVVVGFDGRPAGADALAFARWYSGIVGARLIVAAVHPSPAAISPARVDAEWVADRYRAAEHALARARELAGGADAEYRVVASSSAAHGLHDLADEVVAGLIVVGSHAGGPAGRLFAGSTADRLLAGARCPVAVAPTGLRERPGYGRDAGDVRIGVRIGVAYIEEPEAVAALTAAAAYGTAVTAQGGAAALRLYTVAAAEAEVLPFVLGRDAERAFTASAREAYQAALDDAVGRLPDGLPASGHLLTGDAATVLAELTDVDVLFCGSRGYGPVRRVLLGGVSSRLVRLARAPLVVVPRGA